MKEVIYRNGKGKKYAMAEREFNALWKKSETFRRYAKKIETIEHKIPAEAKALKNEKKVSEKDGNKLDANNNKSSDNLDTNSVTRSKKVDKQTKKQKA